MKWYWSNGCDILLILQEARRFLAPKLRQKNGQLGSKLSQRGLINPEIDDDAEILSMCLVRISFHGN